MDLSFNALKIITSFFLIIFRNQLASHLMFLKRPSNWYRQVAVYKSSSRCVRVHVNCLHYDGFQERNAKRAAVSGRRCYMWQQINKCSVRYNIYLGDCSSSLLSILATSYVVNPHRILCIRTIRLTFANVFTNLTNVIITFK